MKAKQYLLILSVLCFTQYFSFGQELAKVWNSGPVFKTPESVLYDHSRSIIFVSNINNSPKEKDGNGFISLLNTDGTIKKLEWVKGLDAPKGMAVYDGKLYVANIDELVEIDIEKAQILKRYPINGATFLNDVAVDDKGIIYTSDSDNGNVHILKDGKIIHWLHDGDIGRINGLFVDDGQLFIGSDRITKVDIQTKEVKLFQKGCFGIDGLEKDNSGNFVFSNWVGRIFYLKDGKMIKMMDSTQEKINTADLDYALELDLLFVPTFFKNQVIAYRIKK